MNDLINLYLSTCEQNLNDFRLIQDELKTELPLNEIFGALSISSDVLMSMWASGRKSIRTAVAREVIADYPAEILQPSLIIDSVVNLFDELIDEILLPEQKNLLIMELIRALALSSRKRLPHFMHERIGRFFEKGIVIAISENVYLKRLKESLRFENRMENIISVYNCKSLDIDIFFEMPLLRLYGEKINLQSILELARIDRILSLIEKDYHDVSHDALHETDTPVSIIFLHKNGDCINYLHQAANHFLKTARKKSLPADRRLRQIFENLSERIEKNHRKIINLGNGDTYSKLTLNKKQAQEG